MQIRIKSNVDLPEVPGQVEMGPGTLRDLLLRVVGPLKIADEVIDPASGEIRLEGFFEVRLNGVSAHSLTKGLDEELHDGDVMHLNLMVFGGG